MVKAIHGKSLNTMHINRYYMVRTATFRVFAGFFFVLLCDISELFLLNKELV